MSRSLIIGVIITLSLIIGLAFFFYSNYIKVKYKAAIEAVPNDAAFIMEFDNIQEAWNLLENTDIWQDIKQNEAFGQLNTQLIALDSLIQLSPDLNGVFTNHQSTVSIHSNNGAQMGLLFITSFEESNNESKTIQDLAQLFKLKSIKRLFDKEPVYDFVDGQRQVIFSLAIKENLLLISKDATLVEESIRKLKYKFNNNTKGFDKLRSIAEVNSAIHLYVNYQKLPSLLSLIQKSAYAGINDYLKAFANWSVFNLDIEKDKITFNGATFTDDSLFQFLDLFKTQVPHESNLSNFLPSSTSFCMQFNFSNYGQFHSDLNEYLQNHGLQEEYMKYIDSVESRYAIAINDQMVPLVGNSIAIGLVESNSFDLPAKSFALVQFQDNSQAENILNQYVKKIEQRGEGDTGLSVTSMNNIQRLNLGTALKSVFGKYFAIFNNPYFIKIDGGILFANDKTVLNQIIDELRSGNTLAKSATYLENPYLHTANFNINLFIKPHSLLNAAQIFGSDDFISMFNRYQYDIKKLEFISLQYSNSNNNTFYTTLNYKFNPSFKEETKMMWAAQLDTTINQEPAIVFNSTSNQKMILVQDVKNTLYCFDNAGLLAWRSKLSGKILSKFIEVNADKTSEVFYLFNTDKQVFLIGSDGVSHAGYPIRLPGTTEQSIQLIDFYKDSSFVYFLPLTNNKIIGYQLNGRPVNGWNPRNTQEKITSDIDGFRIGAKAYLMSSLSNKLWLNELLGYKTKGYDSLYLKPNTHPIISSKDSNSITFWVTDTLNNMVLFKLDSTLRPIKVKEWKWNLEWTKLKYYSSSSGDYFAASSKSQLLIVNQDGIMQYAQTIADSLWQLSSFSKSQEGELMIGFTEPITQKINWVNTKGAQYPTLPLEGNSPFITADLLQNKVNYIIVGDKLNKLRLYRLK